MRVTDSRDNSGVGILALQDHTPNEKVGSRFLIAAARKTGRLDIGQDLGHVVTERDSAGDLIGGMLWRSRRSAREINAWSFVFPSQTTIDSSETVTVGGPASGRPVVGGPVVGDGVGGDPGTSITATGGVTLNAYGGTIPFVADPHLSENSAFGFNANIDDPNFVRSGPIQPATGAARSNGSTGDQTASWVRGYAEIIEPPIVRPTTDTKWDVDERFKAIRPTQPTRWPQIPRNWHGLTVQSTNEDRQIEYFHPTDPRIPLVHNNGKAACGAIACDLDANNAPNDERHARLHTMLRILRSPGGARNVVAWNLTTTGRGDGRGGYVIDRSEGGTETNKRRPQGPTTPSDRGRTPDPRVGTDFRGPVGGVVPGLRTPTNRAAGAGAAKISRLVVGLMSHNDGGVLHPGLPNDKHQISTDGDGNPVNPTHITTDALFINPSREHEDGPLALSDTFRPGETLDYPVEVVFAYNGFKEKFDWYTWAAEEEPPYEPPDYPPSDPPPPGPPPNQPPPPTTPSDPGRTPDPRVPTGQMMISVRDGRTQDSASPFTLARMHTRRWMEMQVSAMSFRAQRWGVGQPDMIHSRAAGRTIEGPTVMRIDTFAAQTGGIGDDYSRNRAENLGPYCGGTADGGSWLVPPEVSGEDYGSAFAPAGRSLSSPVFGLLDAVTLGFGRPRIENGSIENGYGVKGNDGDLEFRWYSAAGSPSHVFSMTSDRTIRLLDLGADPPTPPSGYVDLYAKSGDLFQIDDTGTVTSLV